jgi:hypothetical protein
MLSTHRTGGCGTQRCLGRLTVPCAVVLLVGLLAVALIGIGPAQAGANPPQPLPPHFPEHPTTTPNWPPPNWPPPHGESDSPPPDSSPPASAPPSAGSAPSAAPASGGVGGVAGATSSGHAASKPASSPRPSRGSVIVTPTPNPVSEPAPHHKKAAKPKALPVPIPPPAPIAAPAAPQSNPDRSTFADRLLAPTAIDLSAKNLGVGGMLALLLAALLYLPVTIFNKATEKNHETIRRWFARPRAWFAALFGWIPFAKHPVITLTLGVVASAGLFSFIEPGFPTEPGALEYLIGMVIGFALVSIVFFSTWRFVIHRLEPDGEGHWEIYAPFIVLAAFLVILARLAHFIPGVVLGTVAEYEPAKKLSVRTAGIRVATTYGALMILGLAAWFAWIPVEHAASKEGASSLTLILDSALAITFVSGLESVAFGLIPMKFLDGNDLFTWHKGLWAAMWGAALVWFSVVILHPALSTYGELSSGRAVWFVLLFSTLMVIALSTWAYFKLRDARLARTRESTT